MHKSLSEQLQSILKDCPFVKGYKLAIQEFPQKIVVSGTVNSYFAKQMAQETMLRFLKDVIHKGVTPSLENEIVVKRT